jgi:hypothetical protein
VERNRKTSQTPSRVVAPIEEEEKEGIVTKSLRKKLEAAPRKHSVDSLQKQLYLEHHT